MSRKKKIIIGIIALLIVVAIPLTVFIVQKQQEIRQRASGGQEQIELYFSQGNDCDHPITTYSGTVGQQDTLSLCLDTKGIPVNGFDFQTSLAGALGITIANIDEGAGTQQFNSPLFKILMPGTTDTIRFAKTTIDTNANISGKLQLAKATFTIQSTGTGTMTTPLQSIMITSPQGAYAANPLTVAPATLSYTVSNPAPPRITTVITDCPGGQVGSVTVNFTGAKTGEGIERFEVTRKPAGDTTIQTIVVDDVTPGNDNTYTLRTTDLQGVTKGSVYKFQIRAYDANDTLVQSSAEYTTAITCGPQIVSMVTDCPGGNISRITGQFTGLKSGEGIERFEVKRKNPGETGYGTTVQTIPAGTSNTYNIEDASIVKTAGQQYLYQILGYNSNDALIQASRGQYLITTSCGPQITDATASCVNGQPRVAIAFTGATSGQGLSEFKVERKTPGQTYQQGTLVQTVIPGTSSSYTATDANIPPDPRTISPLPPRDFVYFVQGYDINGNFVQISRDVTETITSCQVSPPPVSPTEPVTPTAPITLPPGASAVALTYTLTGIGVPGGNCTGNGCVDNPNPLSSFQTRNVTVCLYGSGKNPAGDTNCTNASYKVTRNSIFDAQTKAYNATIPLPANFQTGSYDVLLKVPNYLRKRVVPNQLLTSGQTNTLPQTRIVGMDMNNDNALNLLDYNIFWNCENNKAICTANLKTASDFNADGIVNIKDRLIFGNSFENQSGD